MYTAESQAARRRVRKSPEFDALVRELWDLVRGGEPALSEGPYKTMARARGAARGRRRG